MLHNADIVECLIFLENKGIEDAEIIEKMGINRSTLSRWWKENKSTPRLLQKMRKWCDSFLPITETYRGRRPPEYLFLEAIDYACDADYYDSRYMRHHLRYKGFYDKGIPAATSRGRCNSFRGIFPKDPPSDDYVMEVLMLFHPDPKVREAFSILSNEIRQDSEVV